MAEVRLSKKAAKQATALDSWWAENRTEAPALFAQEFANAIALLRVAPGAGARFQRSSVPGVRRVVLQRTLLRIAAKNRARFIGLSRPAMIDARANPHCVNFSVAADPIDANTLNVFEQWKSREAMERFRGSGPDDESLLLVEAFDVREYEVED